jgi:hypothetical protein
MILLGRGDSRKNFKNLKHFTLNEFTIECNGWESSPDVIAAADCTWIKDNLAALKTLKIPILTRDWPYLNNIEGIDFIRLPNEVVSRARLTGMMAAWAMNKLAKVLSDTVYAIGMDGGISHYDGTKPGTYKAPKSAYTKLSLKRIKTLGPNDVTGWVKTHTIPKRTPADKSVYLFELKKIASNWGKKCQSV